MTRCPYCFRMVDYADHLATCPAVLAAFVDGYGPFLVQGEDETVAEFSRRRLAVQRSALGRKSARYVATETDLRNEAALKPKRARLPGGRGSKIGVVR